MSEDEKKEVIEEKKEPEKEAKPEPNKFEESARAKGWKPKEEFEGDEGKWIGAEEFLKREPLFDRIKQTTNEVKELKKTIEAMATSYKKNVEAEVSKRLVELRSQKKEAIQIGDVEKVEEIDKAIEEQKQIKADVPKQEDIKPEIKEFVDANPWFNSNKEMADFAIAYNKSQVDSGLSLGDALKKTAQAVKRAFPDNFKNQERQKAPPTVETPNHEKGVETKYTVSRLTDDQKRVYEQMVKRHKILTHEEYFKGLEQIGELQ
jgi:hypothetical protein